MSAQKKSPAEPGFAESIRELERILAGIEGEEVDLDRLAAELERAATLLELCRGKLRKAELEVTEIVDRLEGDDGDAAGDTASD